MREREKLVDEEVKIRREFASFVVRINGGGGRVGGAINQNGEKIKTTTRFFDVYSPQQSV